MDFGKSSYKIILCTFLCVLFSPFTIKARKHRHKGTRRMMVQNSKSCFGEAENAPFILYYINRSISLPSCGNIHEKRGKIACLPLNMQNIINLRGERKNKPSIPDSF